MLETNRKLTGSDLFGYWPFFCREDAGEVIETHVSIVHKPMAVLLTIGVFQDRFVFVISFSRGPYYLD